MQNYRGLTDKELLEKLKSIPHGSLQGPTRKLYEKKIYEFETRRCRLGGSDDPDHDVPPPLYGGGARARQPVQERFRAPPAMMEAEPRLDHPTWGAVGGGPLPREPLRPPPPPPSGPPPRMLPLRPQRLALGLLVALLVLLHWGGWGGPPPAVGETPP
ncbi:emerin [Melopsittacus undulatus]|uniref:emerin n=1 Tax=Melopsittacus undulatus TaxID=13146 RepID=UPI00146AF347|nr:emerin [Melopsittacus undulatus]